MGVNVLRQPEDTETWMDDPPTEVRKATLRVRRAIDAGREPKARQMAVLWSWLIRQSAKWDGEEPDRWELELLAGYRREARRRG